MDKTVTVYSTQSCVYCNAAKKFFSEKGVSYTEHDVGNDLARREEMIKKTNQMGVPVIDMDGQIVIGFDQRKIEEILKLK